jgi:hypothetical protein
MPTASDRIARHFEEIHMKRFFGFALMLALLSAPAFAGGNTQTLNLSGAVTIGSTQLSVGDCKVTWTGAGPDVQVTLTQKGKAPVTVPAKLLKAKNGHKAVTTNTKGGVDILQTIELDNLTLVLGS